MGIIACVWFAGQHQPGTVNQHPVVTTVSAIPAPPARSALNAPLSPPTPIRPAPVAPSFSSFQLHPFKVARSNSAFGWTAEDGKDTNIMRQLAHNDLEYQRMALENNSIYRRQLIYHTTPFSLQAVAATQAGQPIQQITLPDLDGQVLTVEVTRTDFENGGQRGIFYGKLPGQPDSMVTVAFIQDREAFTVVSRQKNLYLQAEPREPGEILVKSIDPSTYGGVID